MKNILSALTLIFCFTTAATAQQKKDIVTDTVTVKGTCEQCKKRIENAAYLPGVKLAEWNQDTKILTVTYKKSKTSLAKIEQHIAEAGHDAGSVTAPAEKYKKLPACCAYNDHDSH